MNTSGVSAPPAPGPSTAATLFDILRHGRRIDLAGLVDLRDRYGDVIRFQVGRRIVHIVSGPDDVRHVLQTNQANYTKGRGLAKARALLGDGLLTSEGAHWRTQRRLAQPAFARHRTEGFAPDFTAVTLAMLDRWAARRPDQVFDAHAEMLRLTLEAVSRTLFSTGLRPEEAAVVADVMPPILHQTVRRAQAYTDIGERLPLPANRRYRRDVAALDAIVYRIISERRRPGATHDDLLGMLMAARDDRTGTAMSDRQLRDEVMTIFLAGHETTANLLAFTWWLLSTHPAERRRLEEEVDRVVGLRPIEAADLRHLVVTRRVIDEALRLYPPAWVFQRQAVADDVVGGYRLPAGSQVLISPYLIHRQADLWPEPERFDPDRFLPDRSAGRSLYAYVPFGGGPRICIGSGFALQEAVQVVATVAARYRLEVAPDHPVVPEPSFTLRPAGGVPVVAVPRVPIRSAA